MIREDSNEDRVFGALAHPLRRRMLDLIMQSPGATVRWLADHIEISRIATMKHLATLDDAGLVIREKKGRERRHYFNPVPIQQIYDRWTDQYSSFWAGHLVDMQSRVEARAAARAESSKKEA